MRADSNEAVAARLRQLRFAVSGRNQTAFAAKIEMEPKRWNNFERGYPLSKDAAFSIIECFPDITLDWLFRGIEDGLSVRRQRALAEAGKTMMESAKRTG